MRREEQGRGQGGQGRQRRQERAGSKFFERSPILPIPRSTLFPSLLTPRPLFSAKMLD
ncbi:MAG: hypothetical protein CLLPBCKN_003685 [Chroococcidiopsis cubana SAG 39.79]|uniref:hypothetical protein n=1 Tax=Chroococcidiopsis cubana TaxID=171392 RepID=UPI0013153F5A|nr:hypothetical protein [Chroococcidiopsis cubana]MDZ4874289.1 hypothetical protein [Chroococcidiopsis cubana SAG 39.79]